MSAIVAALYIAHIGHDAPVSFLSNIFRTDVGAIVDRFKAGNSGLHLIRVEHGQLKTVPSIGASAILREIVPALNKRLIVDTVVTILKWVSERDHRDDFEQHIFTQMMRYSILSTVVEDVGERNRFFDNVSKIDSCRTRVLFWVQWHMAMVDQKRFGHAEIYLQRGYTEASNFERQSGNRYDRVQLDDRKAKFLMIRDRSEDFRVNMIYDLREACQITERQVRRNDLTHHPFDTLVEIVEFFQEAGPKFEEPLRGSGRAIVERLGDLIRQRAGLLDEGYPTSRAKRAVDCFDAFMNRHRTGVVSGPPQMGSVP